MLTGGASLEQQRRGLVDLVGERKILELRLSCTTSALRHLRAVRHTPGPAQDLDLVLVFVVQRLALDVADLREDVCCHGSPLRLPLRRRVSGGEYGALRRPVKVVVRVRRRARMRVPMSPGRLARLTTETRRVGGSDVKG